MTSLDSYSNVQSLTDSVKVDTTTQQVKEVINQAVRDAVENDINRGVLREKTVQLDLKNRLLWSLTDKVFEANKRTDLKDIELKYSNFQVTKRGFIIGGLIVLEVGTIVTGVLILTNK